MALMPMFCGREAMIADVFVDVGGVRESRENKRAGRVAFRGEERTGKGEAVSS